MTDVAVARPTEQSLLDAATRLAGAERWGNVAVLDDLLAPEYRGFDAAGREKTRSSVIAGYSDGQVRISTLRLGDLRVKVIGPVGLVTGIASLAGRRGNREFDLRLRFLDAYTWTDAGWRLLASQDARLP